MECNAVRSPYRVASLAALLVMSTSVSAFAGSFSQKASHASASYSSKAAAMSRAEEPVPPNCIRQECGKLWCWHMNGSKSSGR
jgi:hypothetical protein